MNQEQKTKATSKNEQEELTDLPQSEVAARKDARDEEIDGLLADIDNVLEENAQAFVDAYVQKGGQ